MYNFRLFSQRYSFSIDSLISFQFAAIVVAAAAAALEAVVAVVDDGDDDVVVVAVVVVAVAVVAAAAPREPLDIRSVVWPGSCETRWEFGM